ncbi:hypothetical protein ACHAXR_005382 [Thalassiosira sp. AJA248-18]
MLSMGGSLPPVDNNEELQLRQSKESGDQATISEEPVLESSALNNKRFSTLATCTVPGKSPFQLIIAQGSIVDFSYPVNQQSSAIVNSYTIFGGGVDQAVSDAGGPNLDKDRHNHNKLSTKGEYRREKEQFCAEGSAVILGPNKYGRLQVPYVIYASGGGGNSDEILSSSYTSSLECAKSANLESIAFCLISAGGMRGLRTIDDFVKVGLKAIRQFDGYPALKSVYLCGYTKSEATSLNKYAKEIFSSSYMTLSMDGSPSPIVKKRPMFGKGMKEFIPTMLDEKRTFSTLATYNISGKFPYSLIIAKGSIVDFSYPLNRQHSAIVNAANEECLGGSGVDGVVSLAGGQNLLDDRHKLPTRYSPSKNRGVRCPVGTAVITGPNSYGTLKVPHVIHAFGGFKNETLASAYTSSLECGKSKQIEAIAFSLLSTDYYRGSRSMDEVITIGLKSIQSFGGYDQLKAVYVVAFSETEADCLAKLSSKIVEKSESIDIGGSQVAKKMSSLISATTPTSLFKRIAATQKKIDDQGNEKDHRVDGNSIANDPKMPVGEVIGGCHQRNSIDYTNEGLGDEDISPLSEALEKDTNLESIYMNGNRISMLNARLTRALAHSQTLKLLWLENNQIGVEGAGRLADALILNESIEHLFLGRNRLGDNGVGKLADALQVNQTIRSIDLHNNSIGDVAAERIAGAMMVNRSLRSVNLQRNQITDDGAGLLADALRCNNSIETLELAYNPIKESLQQGFADLLACPRSVSLKMPTKVKSSLFFTKLMELDEDGSDITEKLEVLSRIITDVYMMRFYYTTVAMLQKSGILTHENASKRIKKGLDKTASICTCSNSISSFKLILEKAESDQYIQRFDFHRFDNQAEVARMESAPFIADIRESIARNTSRIQGLEANVDAINHSLNTIKDGLKRQMKIEATVGFVCAALNAISFGVGGSILDASINALGSIVDYSDLAHIQYVAEQWGEGCMEQVQTGIDLVSSEYAEKSLQGAVKRGHTLTVVSATAAMIGMQYSLNPIYDGSNQPVEAAPCSEPIEKLLTKSPEKRSLQDKLNQFLTEEESNKEVMQWLATHLPKLRQEDAMKYCECLVEDGFDSEDILANIEEEDLHFMKKAHKRSLVQRVRGKSVNIIS